MVYFILKSLVSGILIALASTLAKRNPGFGALVASLPLVSILGMIWLWIDKPNVETMAAHVFATFWYVIPSLPMFLMMPLMLRHGVGFWPTLATGCIVTALLYTGVTWAAARLGLQL